MIVWRGIIMSNKIMHSNLTNLSLTNDFQFQWYWTTINSIMLQKYCTLHRAAGNRVEKRLEQNNDCSHACTIVSFNSFVTRNALETLTGKVKLLTTTLLYRSNAFFWSSSATKTIQADYVKSCCQQLLPMWCTKQYDSRSEWHWLGMKAVSCQICAKP